MPTAWGNEREREKARERRDGGRRERDREERDGRTTRVGQGWCENFPWGFSPVAFYRCCPLTFTFDHQALHETHWTIVVAVSGNFSKK